MKIGVAQMSVVPGAIETNIATMTTMITEAKTAGCAVVAFPEMCVGGYLIGDRWLDESFVDELIAANDRLASLSDGIVLLYGNAAIEPGDGVQRWPPSHVQRRVLFPKWERRESIGSRGPIDRYQGTPSELPNFR